MNFEIDEQQRDFASSIDAALGAANVPAAVRAWADGDTAPGRKVWNQLAELGVTALLVAEKFDGIDAHPVDAVVALERLGYWAVPGPVTESVVVAPLLLGDDERSAALASGESIATVALPPQVPYAVNADFADLVLLAGDGQVADAVAGAAHDSVDPARKLFEVSAPGATRNADTARAYEFGVLGTAAQLIGAGQAMLDAANNVTNSARITGMIPSEEGGLVVSLAPSSRNNNANHFTYLGVLRMDVVPPPLAFRPPVIDSGRIRLEWAGAGQLEQAASVLGPWSAIADSGAPPHTEQILPGEDRFFRLTAPRSRR